MGYENLLILQFIAHIFADFFLQSDKWVREKKIKGLRSRYMYLHILLVFTLSWIFSLQFSFFWYSAMIAAAHFAADGLKYLVVKKNKGVRIIFYADQVLHLLVLWGVCSLYFREGLLSGIIPGFDTRTLLIAAGFLIITRPANIVIKEILRSYNIIPFETEITSDDISAVPEVPNAGKLIGSVERVLALTLILADQWSALGFIIAAKSILRFRDTDTLKTEYVLVGTLLSFSAAVFTGVVINILL